MVNGIPTTFVLGDKVKTPVKNNVATHVMFDPDNETKWDGLLQHVNRLLISRYYSEALSSPPSSKWNSR